MPAAMRGGSRVSAKPRAKTPPSTKKSPAVRARGTNAYAPAKLRAAEGVGLSATHALLAAVCVLIMAVIATLATGGRAQRLGDMAHAAVGSKFATLGFKLKTVRVLGASKTATADILKIAGLKADLPLFGVDLEALRTKIEMVGWVKSVRVVRLLPDTLVLQVEERRQLAVWQHAGVSRVIDERGQIIAEADARQYTGLPLIVGDGANLAAAPILTAVTQRPLLANRVDALIRVDGRRWNLRLKDGSLILLPATSQDAALIALELLETKSRILELGFERIDLRNPDVVAVRPCAVAAPGQILANGA